MSESPETSKRSPLSTQRVTGAKVFSATKPRHRLSLGERVTEWIQTHPSVEVIDLVVLQSSDAQFHCLSMVLFYHDVA